MNEFFLMDNMKYLALNIQQIVQRHIETLIKDKNITNDAFTEIEWKDYSAYIFDDIVNMILFGFKTTAEFPMVFGTRLTISSHKEREMRGRARFNIPNFLTFGLFYRFMSKDGRECTK